MIRHHIVHLILPLLCSFNVAKALIPQIPLMDANELAMINSKLFNSHNYKGIYAINSYGWYITQKRDCSLQNVELSGEWYEVKGSYTHDQLGFELFKVDSSNDVLKDRLSKFQYLADKEDLQSNANWVNVLTFVPDPLSQQGRISADISEYTKPLSVISKVEPGSHGYLKLVSGGSVHNFCKEFWPITKRRDINKFYKSFEHIKMLLERPGYQEEFLKANTRRLLEQKINELIQQKNTFIKGYRELYASHFPNLPAPDQSVEQEMVRNVDSAIRDLQKNTREVINMIREEQQRLWQTHQKELTDKGQRISQALIGLKSTPKNYEEINPQSNQWFKKRIINNFKSTHLGVADKNDQGGLILATSKNVHLFDNEYYQYRKVAGIVCVKEGMQVEAIDLTRPEVHEWIANKIDSYYAPQTASSDKDKGKRPAKDTNPNDEVKRPRIKEEAIDDAARRTITTDENVQVKEEIKQEPIKEEC